MKRKVATACVMLTLLLFIALTYESVGVRISKASEGSIMWGTTYGMAQNETTRADDASWNIYYHFNSSGAYEYLYDWYGSPTQYIHVYNNVSHCETYFSFNAIYYYGHCTIYDDGDHVHYFIYDDNQNGNGHIDDFRVHDNMTNGYHDFVFLWACGTANEVGEIYSDGHGRGMAACWIMNDDLSTNGYDSPDYGDEAFIGFENYSKPYLEKTWGSKDYADFVRRFYYYALDGSHTINEALDDASDYAFDDPSSFDETILYTGYWFNNTDVPEDDPMYGNWSCSMRVFGDGTMTLPS